MADVASDSFYHKSPLDTLVRQSSRRTQNTRPLQPPATFTHHEGSQQLNRVPSSPLLHTRFRASASTASTSFMDVRGDDETNTTGQGQHFSWTRDDESVYSSMTIPQSSYLTSDTSSSIYIVDPAEEQPQTPPRFTTRSSQTTMPEQDRLSWESHNSDAIVEMDRSTPPSRNTRWRDSDGVDPFSFRQYESPTPSAIPVPVVVISSPTPSMHSLTPRESPGSPSQTGTPGPSVTQYSISNFSRPIRTPSARHDQSKQEVLERNRFPSHPLQQRQQQRYQSPQDVQAVQSSDQQQSHYNNTSPPPASPSRSFSPPNLDWVEPKTPAIFRSHEGSTSPSSTSELVLSDKFRSPSPNASQGPSNEPSITSSPFPGPSEQPIRLPNLPPSPRPISRASLYSTYSYYQLDDASRTPSPSPHIEQTDASSSEAVSPPSTRADARPSPSPIQPSASGPTPNDFLYLGIQHHEANRLTESAICFERAATMDGGSGVGMLMWGLSLRHAWGTPKDEKAAFRWLRKAAEVAVGDLESARNGIDQKAVKTELVLAIYEVGQCFFHGWGVAQDKKMAVSYFQVAARLGDCEAQQELGYCLANGKGCKKNLKEAAKWYRAAAAQGASTVGLAWIYKSKYL